jgi:hypothetical protein
MWAMSFDFSPGSYFSLSTGRPNLFLVGRICGCSALGATIALLTMVRRFSWLARSGYPAPPHPALGGVLVHAPYMFIDWSGIQEVMGSSTVAVNNRQKCLRRILPDWSQDRWWYEQCAGGNRSSSFSPAPTQGVPLLLLPP